jgi:hypothetical protein
MRTYIKGFVWITYVCAHLYLMEALLNNLVIAAGNYTRVALHNLLNTLLHHHRVGD